MVADYTSGDLARATGNTVRTIRFYEEEGLLEPAELSDGGHRRYTDDDLDRLRLIGDLRELGLSLCEIKDILGLRKGCSCVSEFAQRLEKSLAGHVAEAQRRMERLERVRREIERAIEVVHSHMDGVGGTIRPCDLSCAPDAPKILRVLAPRDAACALQASREDARAGEAAAAPGQSGQASPAEPVAGWVAVGADRSRPS